MAIFEGIVILASDQKENTDGVFAKRLESVVYFPMPRHNERLRLWRHGFSPKVSRSGQAQIIRAEGEHRCRVCAVFRVDGLLPHAPPEERPRMRRQVYPPKPWLENSVALCKIAAQLELCGGSSMKIVRCTTPHAFQCSRSLVTLAAFQRYPP